MATSKPDRTIEILFRDGSRERVSGIPAAAKITYGPIQPGVKHYGEGNALRVYTTQNNQLAVFVDVQSFRDLSLTVQREKINTERADEHEDGPEGVRAKTDFSETREWVDV